MLDLWGLGNTYHADDTSCTVDTAEPMLRLQIHADELLTFEASIYPAFYYFCPKYEEP